MLAKELHEIAAAAKATRMQAQTKSFIIFVLDTAKKEAMAGRFGFVIQLNTIASWNEEEMRAAFSAIEEDGFKISISNVDQSNTGTLAMQGYFSAAHPQELKVNW